MLTGREVKLPKLSPLHFGNLILCTWRLGPLYFGSVEVLVVDLGSWGTHAPFFNLNCCNSLLFALYF